MTAPTHAQAAAHARAQRHAVVVLALFVAVLLSISAIQNMFKERAQLMQSYDVGQGGRFRLQELALGSVLNFPNGMGPFEFARVHGLQQHNVYLQAFLVYGWLGAMAYMVLLLSTVLVGLRTALRAHAVAALSHHRVAAFIGEIAEGFVIDTDHWRHFYLLLGMIWGLAAATTRYRAAIRRAAYPAADIRRRAERCRRRRSAPRGRGGAAGCDSHGQPG